MKSSLAENIQAIGIEKKISGSRIGSITGIDKKGLILIDFPGNTLGPLPARFVESIKQKLLKHGVPVNDKILIIFENDDPGLPIIIDAICDTLDDQAESDAVAFQVQETEDVTIDGRRVTFDAKEQIELRCGKSSIILTRAGKVLIRGAYLLSRSTGANRIKGGSVQLN
ncbi:MAG: hypothetical protein KAJ07_10630 [Planctomycetes bacterium]|nr:hypothetical protein [Planctomycetota bacterium]